MGISILLLKNYLEPKERGFFCNDTSLRYPYHDSSITTLVNNIICYGAPILIIIVKNLCDVQIKSRQSRGACQSCIREISLFLFAVFTVQVNIISPLISCSLFELLSSSGSGSNVNVPKKKLNKN